MKYVILALLSLIFMSGCIDKPVESALMTEDARVVKTIFEPRRTGSSSGIGVTSSGDVAFVGGDVTMDEHYAVVFECQHGEFAIEGTGKDSKAFEIWRKVRQGDNVTVFYRELYKVQKDGSKTFHDFKFEDANRN